MKRLIIIGAGGFGREVLSWARQNPACGTEWELAGFLDDDPEALAGSECDLGIISRIGDYNPDHDDLFVCAIGLQSTKRRICGSILERGGVFFSLVHPTAILGDNVSLGRGVILCPHVVLTADISIGDFVSLNLYATVGHDAVIADWCHVSSHCDITAGAVLDEGVFLGSHAVILPGTRVGAGAVVGAGSVVLRRVPDGATVFGSPARRVPG
jgi:sugar O-acyltransferase (sialic acid O-acetyltransferase NeuD family)